MNEHYELVPNEASLMRRHSVVQTLSKAGIQCCLPIG